MTHAGKEVVFLMHLHCDISSPLAIPIPMLVDNQSAIALVENLIFHARSKHIEVCQHWIREKVEDGVIQLEYVPTVDQTADIFTKALNAEKFQRSQDDLGLVEVKAH